MRGPGAAARNGRSAGTRPGDRRSYRETDGGGRRVPAQAAVNPQLHHLSDLPAFQHRPCSAVDCAVPRGDCRPRHRATRHLAAGLMPNLCVFMMAPAGPRALTIATPRKLPGSAKLITTIAAAVSIRPAAWPVCGAARRLELRVGSPLPPAEMCNETGVCLDGWSNPASECCGEWTAGGSDYIFQSAHGGRPNLWGLHEASFFSPGRHAHVAGAQIGQRDSQDEGVAPALRLDPSAATFA